MELDHLNFATKNLGPPSPRSRFRGVDVVPVKAVNLFLNLSK
jgi:hypothetical protein